MEIILHILLNNIFPVFILILGGYGVSKKFNLDINTLSKLNFYIFVPSFILVTLYTTSIPMEMLKVLVFALIFLGINAIVAIMIAKIRHYDKAMKNAFKNSIMFINVGNIGIPLITLVYSSAPFIHNGEIPYLDIALTAQVMIYLTQSVGTNSIGFFNAGSATMQWKDSLKKVLNMPIIYTIPVALILKTYPYDLTTLPIWTALVYGRNAMIAIALITLGVQLSKTTFQFRNKEIYLSSAIRLLGGPVLAYILIFLMGFEGVIAQVVMISSALPIGVNTALIAVECKNCPDFASQVVVTSTLFSAITLPLVIYVARILFPMIS